MLWRQVETQSNRWNNKQEIWVFLRRLHLSEDLKIKMEQTFSKTGEAWAFPAKETSGVKTHMWKRLWHSHRTWKREWQPTPVFLLGESHRQRSQEDYSPWGHEESDTTEWLPHTHIHTHSLSLSLSHTHTHTTGQVEPYGQGVRDAGCQCRPGRTRLLRTLCPWQRV